MPRIPSRLGLETASALEPLVPAPLAETLKQIGAVKPAKGPYDIFAPLYHPAQDHPRKELLVARGTANC